MFEDSAESRRQAAVAYNECVAIPQMLDKMEWNRKREVALTRIKHGHDFGRDYKCSCGLTDLDYHIARNQHNFRPACPDWDGKVAEQITWQEWGKL